MPLSCVARREVVAADRDETAIADRNLTQTRVRVAAAMEMRSVAVETRQEGGR